MIHLSIDNSYSQINNLPSAPFNKLRKELSYSIDKQAAYFSKNQFNTIRYCIDKKGIFPTGLLKRVKAFLLRENIKCQFVDLRAMPHKLAGLKMTLPFKPHAWQLEAVDFITKNRCGIISATTGSGKSLVIALIAARLNVRTLVVVPSIEIKEQLTGQLESYFGHTHNIQIYNVAAPILKKKTDFDLLIVDEAHHAASKTYRDLNKTAWKGIYHRVFLTATPFRNQTEETLLFEGIAGTDIHTLTYAQAIKHGYVVPIEAYYLESPKIKTEAHTWQEVYSELVTNNVTKNQIVAETLLKFVESKIFTLCLVKEIKHGQILSEITGIPFVNGQDEESRDYIRQFNNGGIMAVIGTEGVLGEGVDTKPCEVVIIAGAGKAKSSFMQKIGRSIRIYPGKESGKVILIQDKSHKFLSKHFKEQCAILEQEYGVSPIKLEI